MICNDYKWQCRICKKVFRTRREKEKHYSEEHSEYKGIVWNKGLTKETDEIVRRIANKTKGTVSKNRGKTLEEIMGVDRAKQLREHWKQNPKMGGFRIGSGRGKAGWYKGFWCCSSYELAFVIYCLEHNINIKQCTDKFSYVYKNQSHTYLPDFIVDGIYIEIKGYETEIDKIKYKSIPSNKKLKVLYKNDLEKEIKYCQNKYGLDYIKLYDRRANKKPKLCPVCKKEIKTKKGNYCSKYCCWYSQNQNKINELKQKIIQSNIDFSKHGWVTKASKLLNIKTQHVREFIIKHMNDIIDINKLFKRNNI